MQGSEKWNNLAKAKVIRLMSSRDNLVSDKLTQEPILSDPGPRGSPEPRVRERV